MSNEWIFFFRLENDLHFYNCLICSSAKTLLVKFVCLLMLSTVFYLRFIFNLMLNKSRIVLDFTFSLLRTNRGLIGVRNDT